MNFDQSTKPLDLLMDEIEEKQEFLVTQMDAGLSEGDLIIYILRRNCHSKFRDIIQKELIKKPSVTSVINCYMDFLQFLCLFTL
mmetsp:Transcript_38847/g.67266  ORF Transcript_38847/g.67266 Transcript_38847/m.67266 type:complete len:84 (-) Transcript_38847:513-764(-)